MPDACAMRRGYTLIECLLAGMILAGFGAAMAAAIGQASVAQAKSNDYRIAAQWLDEAMTRIDLVGPRQLLYEGPTEGRFDERFTWAASVRSTATLDLYQVEVTIGWASAYGARSVEGHTLLYDPSDATTPRLRWDDL